MASKEVQKIIQKTENDSLVNCWMQLFPLKKRSPKPQTIQMRKPSIKLKNSHNLQAYRIPLLDANKQWTLKLCHDLKTLKKFWLNGIKLTHLNKFCKKLMRTKNFVKRRLRCKIKSDRNSKKLLLFDECKLEKMMFA